MLQLSVHIHSSKLLTALYGYAPHFPQDLMIVNGAVQCRQTGDGSPIYGGSGALWHTIADTKIVLGHR